MNKNGISVGEVAGILSERSLSPIEQLAEMVNMSVSGYEARCKSIAKDSAGRMLSDDEFSYFLSIAAKYKLNPLGKGEIYAFTKKGGGLQIIVGVDGWINIANRHPDWGGMGEPEYTQVGEDVICVVPIFKKGIAQPFRIPVSRNEFRMDSNPNWIKRERWMHFVRTFCMTIRFAFGITDIIDTDEAERWEDEGLVETRPPISEPQEPPPAPPPASDLSEKISDKQRKMFYAVAKTTGFSDEEIKSRILKDGFEHTADITKDKFDALLAWARGPEPK